MASVLIGDVLREIMKSNNWKSRMDAIRLNTEWENIMGKTIAKYTKSLRLQNGVLTIFTDVAPLKQELYVGRQQVMANINEFFQDTIIKEVVIK